MRPKQVLIICVAILITVLAANAGALKIEDASEAQRNIIQAALGDQSLCANEGETLTP